MGSRALSRMKLAPEMVAKLAERRVNTAQELLSLSRLDLLELLEDVCDSDIEEVVRSVSATVAGKPVTIQQMWIANGCPYVPTQIKAFDDALGGGLPRGSITELVGPAGVGKTQFCFMLSVAMASGLGQEGNGHSVVYIDTEKKFSSPRVAEILHQKLVTDGYRNIHNLISSALKKILVVMPNTPQEILDQLQELESNIIEHGVGLVILDSVAALVRPLNSRDRIFDRQEMVGQQAARLKYLAEAFKIPVVVTNQVMASFRQGEPSAHSGHGAVVAALGTKWAHCVNTRLMLGRNGTARFIKVAKSPCCPNTTLHFSISTGGIEADVVGEETVSYLQNPAADAEIPNG